MTTKIEKAVRDAAVALREAIDAARADGLVVPWPTRYEDLDAIAVSEGGAARTVVSAAATAPVPLAPEVQAKAETAATKAAQKAVDRVVEKET